MVIRDVEASPQARRMLAWAVVGSVVWSVVTARALMLLDVADPARSVTCSTVRCTAGRCVGSGRLAQASCWRAGSHRGYYGEYEQRQQDHDEHDGPQQQAEDKRENDQYLRLRA